MRCAVPLDVPIAVRDVYVRNMHALTRGTGRFFLFVADHKIEHLNDDFCGPDVHEEAHNPEHIFHIAHEGSIGALAAPLGLVVRYGAAYPSVNYIIKITGKTHLANTCERDPMSAPLWSVHNVAHVARCTVLAIRGVGISLYPGGCHEDLMLSNAARDVALAHSYGLVAIVWIYPRARNIADGTEPSVVAGAAGLANALGADFVKVRPPRASSNLSSRDALLMASCAAGNTSLLCAGGSQKHIACLLEEVYEYVTYGGAAGCAIGRNIFQRSRSQAVALTRAISAIVFDGATVVEAHKLLV